jgi:uncharacterized Zn-finger protein
MVNRWAADLPGRVTGPPHLPGPEMTPFETIEIDEMMAACDGGGALGHPRVYLNLAPSGRVECPYCSRLYVNRAVAQVGGVAPEAGAVTPRQVGEIAGGGDE